MLSLYRRVTVQAARRALAAWPAALSLIVYALIFFLATILLMPLGFIGNFLLALVAAACGSSYLELISQAVAGTKIHFSREEIRRTFVARLSDVISVMFAFWIIGLLTAPLTSGSNGEALAAILGFAIAFFFNAVPELLYQGGSRSFALLLASGRFMMANPVAWLLPNLVFAGAALAAGGHLHVHRPAELLIMFGSTFSSPVGVAQIFIGLPRWALPIALFGLHYVMVFRGILFKELSSGSGNNNNARLRAFQESIRRSTDPR